MNEKLQDFALDLVKSLQQAAVQYGPEALQLVLNLRRLDALAQLASGLIAVAVVFLFFKVFQYLQCRWTLKEISENDMEIPLGVAYMALVLGIIGCSIWAISDLLDFWNWVGVFRPDLAIAHDIYEKVISTVTK